MRLLMLLLFIGVPIIELALLIELGRNIGFWWTITIVILTAIIGTAELQRQCLQSFARIYLELISGKPPIMPGVEGMFLLVAGTFLLTPGILTDSFGFLLLFPPLRHVIAKWCLRQFVSSASVHVHMSGMGAGDHDQTQASKEPRRPPPGSGSGPVIDGEFVRVDEKTSREPRGSQAPRGENTRDGN